MNTRNRGPDALHMPRLARAIRSATLRWGPDSLRFYGVTCVTIVYCGLNARS
jgi:hypothetical protein